MVPWQQGPTVGDLVPGSRLEHKKKKKNGPLASSVTSSSLQMVIAKFEELLLG